MVCVLCNENIKATSALFISCNDYWCIFICINMYPPSYISWSASGNIIVDSMCTGDSMSTVIFEKLKDDHSRVAIIRFARPRDHKDSVGYEVSIFKSGCHLNYEIDQQDAESLVNELTRFVHEHHSGLVNDTCPYCNKPLHGNGTLTSNIAEDVVHLECELASLEELEEIRKRK
jgi:hypothetical protein